MPHCKRCNRYFGSSNALWQHTNSSNKHHICDACDRDCTTARGLEQHKMQKHWYCMPCKRMFNNEHGLNTHLRSSAAHNRKTRACPGRGCNKSFVSYADLAQHLESGACRSGFSRSHINYVAVRLDTNRVVTNPNRLIASPGGFASPPRIMPGEATGHSFNGRTYECVLYRRNFATRSALNSHLSSPAHDEKIYRCPVRYDGCAREFRTLSGLMKHVESSSCGVHRFQRQVNRALDDLTSRIGRITLN